MNTTAETSHSRRSRAALLAVGLGAVALLGMGTPATAAESLGAGDEVHITVYQHPDLNTDARVSDRGTIVFPLLGEVRVSGQTPVEAGADIAKKLRAGRYLVDPQVTVSLLEVRSRQVSILGHVAQPGQYALDGTSARLTDVLARAGGISESGDEKIVLIRTHDGKPQRLEIDVPAMYRNGDLSTDLELQAGDALFVPSAPVFYVYGQVQRPGSYRLREPMTVMTALSVGGGLGPHGTDRKLRIHRRMPDGELKVLDATLADPVLADDVIEVRESVF